MRTRTALLSTSLLFATAGVLAQTRPATTIPPTTTTAPTVGQTFTVSGTAYKVSSKTVLTTGVEYYTAKATTPGAVTKNFLRTKNTMNATAFSQKQYAALLKTGKLSTFGQLKSVTVGSRVIQYVVMGSTSMTRGSTSALLYSNGKRLGMLEIPGDITESMKPTGISPERQKCLTSCWDSFDTCYHIEMPDPVSDEELSDCIDKLNVCDKGCYTIPNIGSAVSHSIASPVPIVFQ